MKKLAVIGAGYLQLPLVLKAKKMGIEVHCFAWKDGAVCSEISDFFYPMSVVDKEEILKVCRQIKIDGILTIATDIAVPTISYIAEKLNLISNSYQSALQSTNKYLMRQAFKEAKCSIPKFVEVDSDKSDFKLKYPLIVKPQDRSGSRGVCRVNNKEDLELAIQIALHESIVKSAIIEEYIEGKEVSVESISWQGKHYILTITDKVTTNSPHFVEIAHHQPTTFSLEIIEKIKKETLKSLDALQIKFGAGHTEIKITPEGEVYVIEIGARMGGDFIGSHLVQLSTGYDFLEGVINIALNSFEEPKKMISKYSGVYFLSLETKSLLNIFMQKNDFEIEKSIFNTDLKNISNSNDRSGYLIYQSDVKIELL
ncbi:ATP-grasp domain-containing protein [Flavobacterium oreochromis]|uniref:ATP-grasp domain-containing protein n=1 Tax=Flavobacterium columnare TaxID=996 RepID=A0A246GDY9_9FLAO|nr:ATP-grasp domain-containing protein [Flavobacterium oreochromis]OWP79623.1 hypothetical protein BWK62_01485 [Flavobacterium oreochromis]POR23990.1 hypothetical protein BWK58_09235 [Flavobacterium columnare]